MFYVSSYDRDGKSMDINVSNTSRKSKAQVWSGPNRKMRAWDRLKRRECIDRRRGGYLLGHLRWRFDIVAERSTLCRTTVCRPDQELRDSRSVEGGDRSVTRFHICVEIEAVGAGSTQQLSPMPHAIEGGDKCEMWLQIWVGDWICVANTERLGAHRKLNPTPQATDCSPSTTDPAMTSTQFETSPAASTPTAVRTPNPTSAVLPPTNSANRS